MNVEPFSPPSPEIQQREETRVFATLRGTLQRGGMRALSAIASAMLGMRKYASQQKIGESQALAEMIMALPRMFPPKVCDLGEWIDVVSRVGIPFIPASPGPTVSLGAIEAGMEYKIVGDDLPRAAAWINALPENTVWRWQCCAPEALKAYYGMGCSGKGSPKIPLLLDERLLHIAWSEQLAAVRLYSCPFVQAVIDKDFPVEFRVFVSPKGEAVCSYYPQSPLSPEFAPWMEKAAEYGRLLAQDLPDGFGDSFTCDFLLADVPGQDRELYFLEGGPPHTPNGGAHPCCFAITRDGHSGPQPGRRLLATEEGAQTHIPAPIDGIVETYRAGEIDFWGAVKRAGISEQQMVGVMALKAIVPLEMNEKRVPGTP